MENKLEKFLKSYLNKSFDETLDYHKNKESLYVLIENELQNLRGKIKVLEKSTDYHLYKKNIEIYTYATYRKKSRCW